MKKAIVIGASSGMGVDLIIISAGCIFINPELEYEKEKKTIDLNVLPILNQAMLILIWQ